ncbi:MAG: hypothetical protein AAGA96_09160 [Verrucomicrobiota bacterium]
MKFPHSSNLTTFSVLISLGMLPPFLGVVAQDKGSMRDVAKHEDLSQRLRMSQQNDPIKEIGPAIGKTEEDPSVPQSKRSLLASSSLLCFRGELTLVPKRAVLHVPDHLKSRFEVNGKVQVKNWEEFYLANRGWIRTMEVTRDQAMGYKPMPEATVQAIQGSSSVIIATYQKGPIAVRPYQEKEEESIEGTSEEATTPTRS